MNWMFWKRAQATAKVIVINPPSAQTMERDYQTYVKEAYKANVIAFRSIERITDSLATVPLLLKRKSKTGVSEEVLGHPILELLERPNTYQAYEAFIKQTFGYYLLSGNSYLQAVGPREGAAPEELWALRPDRMTVLPSPFLVPSGYKYKVGANETIFPSDVVTGCSPILQMKTFNPINDWYGMSVIEAAAWSVDQHNQTGKWNLSLLQNSARPSGAIIVKGNKENPGASLNDEQRRFLKEQIDQSIAGSVNSGKPIMLEGNMDWKEMSFNPKDMDWLQGKNASARDVSLAFGVPPQLLGIPGDNTFSNYEQARMAFFIDIVIPMAWFWVNNLNRWLVPAFDENVFLEPDINGIDALDPMRSEKWAQTQSATFLTTNEKRERLGFGKYDEKAKDAADKILIPMGQTTLDLVTEDPFNDEEESNDDFNDFGNGNDDDDNSDDNSDNDDDKAYFVSEKKAVELSNKGILIQYIDGKAVNISSATARERFRSGTIRKRRKIGRKFELQLKAFWRKEQEIITDSIKDIDPQLFEFAINSGLEESTKLLDKVFSNNLREIMEFFGKDVLALAKHNPKIEAKDARSKFDSFVNEFLEKHAGTRITKIQGNTRKRILTMLKFGLAEAVELGETGQDMSRFVRRVYDKFNASRASTIVKTEVGIAQNEAQRAAAKAVDAKKKTWISDQRPTARGLDPNDATIHINMNETSIDINSKFEVFSKDGIDLMEGPQDPSAPADQVINCLCVNVFET